MLAKRVVLGVLKTISCSAGRRRSNTATVENDVFVRAALKKGCRPGVNEGLTQLHSNGLTKCILFYFKVYQ